MVFIDTRLISIPYENRYETCISLNMILEYEIPRLMVYTIISDYDDRLHLKMLSWHQKICLETYIITATGTNNIFL